MSRLTSVLVSEVALRSFHPKGQSNSVLGITAKVTGFHGRKKFVYLEGTEHYTCVAFELCARIFRIREVFLKAVLNKRIFQKNSNQR